MLLFALGSAHSHIPLDPFPVRVIEGMCTLPRLLSYTHLLLKRDGSEAPSPVNLLHDRAVSIRAVAGNEPCEPHCLSLEGSRIPALPYAGGKGHLHDSDLSEEPEGDVVMELFA